MQTDALKKRCSVLSFIITMDFMVLSYQLLHLICHIKLVCGSCLVKVTTRNINNKKKSLLFISVLFPLHFHDQAFFIHVMSFIGIPAFIPL